MAAASHAPGRGLRAARLLLFVALTTVASAFGAVPAGCSRPSSPPRNLVLVSIDTLRADALGAYGGSPAVAPHLDALARDGVVFQNVVSPIPITVAAHATILSGLSPARHGLHQNLGHLLRPEVETLAEVLGRQGFATAAFVSALVLDKRYGLDQGFHVYDDDVSASPQTVFGAERPGADTVARSLSWLQVHRDERFFLFVHLYEPHEPYEPPPTLSAKLPMSPYLAEVATADAAVGQLLEGLRDLDLDDSTLVALVGDHGEMLGEHGEETHTYFVYQSALRVPFLVRLPRKAKVGRVPQLAGLVDVTPTLCGLLGAPQPAGIDGRDLAPLVTGNGAPPPARSYYCESVTPTRYGANPLHGLVGERWKYIRTTRPELYDLKRDPGERSNLAVTGAAMVAERDRELRAILAGPSSGEGPNATNEDRETIRKFASLGYMTGAAEKAIDVDPKAPDPKDLIEVHVLHTRSIQLIAAGKFDGAEPLSRRVLEKLPDSWEANLTLGKAKAGLKQWVLAIPLFERSLELKPAQYEALEGLGSACSALGRSERAVELFRRALPLDRQPPKGAFDLAGALLDRGERVEAERLVAMGAPLSAGRPEALLGLARLLDRLGRGPEAAASLERALALARERKDEGLIRRIEEQLQP